MAIITTCGLTLTTICAWPLPMMAEGKCQTMEGKIGLPITINLPHSFTGLVLTIPFPTTYLALNKTTRACVFHTAQMEIQLQKKIGRHCQ